MTDFETDELKFRAGFRGFMLAVLLFWMFDGFTMDEIFWEVPVVRVLVFCWFWTSFGLGIFAGRLLQEECELPWILGFIVAVVVGCAVAWYCAWFHQTTGWFDPLYDYTLCDVVGDILNLSRCE